MPRDAFDHRFRQGICAAGDGCKAALAAEDYLEGMKTEMTITKEAKKDASKELNAYV